jgi:N-acetyl-anhydromuramyl-L-alanine amidase AmpD
MLDISFIKNPPFIKAKNYYTGRSKPVELIIIHTMEAPEKGTTAESVAKYFRDSGVKASAHYCIDNDSIVQCVWDNNTAWHCKNANSNSIGLEHAGYAAQTKKDWEDEFSLAMLDNSAQLCAYLCEKFNIPVQKAEFKSAGDPTVLKKGICGHVEVPAHGSHWDPGPEFPWDKYLSMVNEYLNGKTGAESISGKDKDSPGAAIRT